MGLIAKIVAALLHYFALALGFLVTLIVWGAVKIFSLLAAGVLAVLNSIPVPEFLSSFGVNLDAIPAGVKFFIGPLDFATGLSWIVTAYVLRFMIRRLPFIG